MLHSSRRFLTLGTVAAMVATGAGCLPGQAETLRPAAQTTDPPPALRAAFVIVDGVYNTELVAPFDVFQHTQHHAPPGIETFTVSPDGRPVTSAEGLEIGANFSFANAPDIDILVVPSAEGSRDHDLGNHELIEWVRQRGQQAKYVVSLCWGAFVLAEANLLDGRSCTTFPSDYARFAETFPELDLRLNVSFVHDGRVLTSQGGQRSFDVAMFLVDHLYGEEVAQKVGSGLLIPWPPQPGEVAFLSNRPPTVPHPSGD